MNRNEDLHHGEGGVVAGDPGEVVLQHGQGAGERHVAAAAEQGHTWEAQDGGHQGGVGHPAQTLDAALEASCRGRWREGGQFTDATAFGSTRLYNATAQSKQKHLI